MAKEYIRLTTKIETWKDRFNDLTNDVGDIALLTTSGEFVVGSDSDLVTAINELDYRLDSINSTQLNSPDMYIHDSARIGGQLVVGGNLTVKGSVTLGDSNTDNVVFNADVNSNIRPNTDNAYDLGSSSNEWRHLYLDGTANIDNLSADSASISGSLTVTGATALNGGLTMDANKFIVADTTGNVSTAGTLTVTGETNLNGGLKMDTNKFTVADTTGNTSIAGTLNVDGVTTLDSATVDGPLHVTGNVQVDGGITVDTNKFIVADATGNTTIAGTLDVDGVTTLDSATVAGTLTVTGKINNFTLLNGEGDSGSYIQFSNKSRLIWGPTGIRIKGATAGADAELQDSNLDTVSKGTTSAINELKSTIDALNSTLADSIDALFTQIGDLSSLNTAAQSNLVAAINEIHGQDSDRYVNTNTLVGTLAGLDDSIEGGSTNIVSAINFVHNRIPNIYDSAGTLLN